MRVLRAAGRAFRNKRAFSVASHESVPDAPKQIPGPKKSGFSAILLFLPCIATFGLGSWQLMRREWKAELLDLKRKRLAEEPVLLGEALHNASDLEYRTVVCEGVFDESKSVFIGPRLKKIDNANQGGYLMVTPLYPVANGSGSALQPPVLVNRGWVPQRWREDFEKGVSVPEEPVKEPPKDKELPKDVRGAWWKVWSRPAPVEDNVLPDSNKNVVRVCGVVRKSEDPNMFVPLNSPSTGQWFYVDVPQMAKVAGLPEDTPYVEAIAKDSSSNDGVLVFPVPKEPEDFLRVSLMPGDHLNYALTWYTLSAATAFMAVKRIQQKPLRRRLL